jgi:Cytochrome c
MKKRTRVLVLASMVTVALIGMALAAGCSGAQTSSSPPSEPAVAPPASSTATTTPAPEPATTPALSGLALGQKIFTTGEDNAGAIPAKGGIAKITVNACKNCHGVDAKGGKKLKIAAPDIRGSVLQPDFNETTFARSVTTGVDDTGKRLHKQMPRFTATAEDTAALWQYLNTLK